MDVFQCYTPTNDRDEQDKEDFYSILLTIFQDCPRRNMTYGIEEMFLGVCATCNLGMGGRFSPR